MKLIFVFVVVQADKENIKDLSRRRRDLFQKYIDASNSKTEIGGIFLDIIIEHDYDPLAGRKDQKKYKIKDLFDPPKKDIHKV